MVEHDRDLLRGITRQAIRRGTFHSVEDLETAIGVYIDGWNERTHPFTWTKNANDIIAHAKPSPNRKKTYGPRDEHVDASDARRVETVREAEVPRACGAGKPMQVADRPPRLRQSVDESLWQQTHGHSSVRRHRRRLTTVLASLRLTLPPS